MNDKQALSEIPTPVRLEAAEVQNIRESTGVLAVGTGFMVLPENMAQATELAKVMSQSKITLREHFRGEVGDCMAVVMQAMRWGMDPYLVANKSYIVNGQMGYEAQLVHAVVLSKAPLVGRPRPEYSGEGLNRQCTISAYLADEEEPFEYTSPKICEIKVQNSPLWTSDPDQQLFYYSIRAWARRHTPEVLLGVYTVDELKGSRRMGRYQESDDLSNRLVRQGELDALPAPKPELETKTQAFVDQLLTTVSDALSADDIEELISGKMPSEIDDIPTKLSQLAEIDRDEWVRVMGLIQDKKDSLRATNQIENPDTDENQAEDGDA